MTWQGTSALRWAEKWVFCNSVTHAWCSGEVMPMEESARGKEESLYNTSIAHKGWFELWCISLAQIKADAEPLHHVRESVGLGWSYNNWNISGVLWAHQGLCQCGNRVVWRSVPFSCVTAEGLLDQYTHRNSGQEEFHPLKHQIWVQIGTSDFWMGHECSSMWLLLHFASVPVNGRQFAVVKLISGTVTLKQRLHLKAPLFFVTIVLSDCCLSGHHQNPIFQSFQILSRFYKVWLFPRIIEWPG